MRWTRIAGIGHHVPPQVVTNHDLEALMDTTVHRGSLVCLAAFGSGFTWAASLLRY